MSAIRTPSVFPGGSVNKDNRKTVIALVGVEGICGALYSYLRFSITLRPDKRALQARTKKVSYL